MCNPRCSQATPRRSTATLLVPVRIFWGLVLVAVSSLLSSLTTSSSSSSLVAQALVVSARLEGRTPLTASTASRRTASGWRQRVHEDGGDPRSIILASRRRTPNNKVPTALGATTVLSHDEDDGPPGDGTTTTKMEPIQQASIASGLVMPACVASIVAVASTALRAALIGGSYGPLGGLGALTAIASLVVVPLTQIKNLYAISVGYGMSVGIMGMILRRTLDPLKKSIGHTLSGCTVFYGLRLAIYLFTREKAGWKPSSSTNRKESSRIQRVPFSLTLAFFYACLVMPVLHVLRSSPALPYQSWKWYVAWTGTIVAWLGAVLEAVADTHKFLVKNQYATDDDNSSNEFVGPVSGVYALTRHPNYTGEVLHWFGTYLAGTVCFGTSWVGWVASSLGLYGIVSIMVAATKGLEKRQQDKYVGDPNYENWKSSVKYPLIPFVQGPAP